VPATARILRVGCHLIA
jgi:hypothetical protein